MSEQTTHPHVAIAERLSRALVTGDVDAISELYAEDIAVFRNFDGRTLPKDKVLKVVRFLVTGVEGLRYDDVRVVPTDKGFVQQHVFRGRSRSGAEVAAPVCLIAEVRDGRIVRIDEYLDSAQMAPLMGG